MNCKEFAQSAIEILSSPVRRNVRRRVSILTRARAHSLLIWVPLLVWLAAEVYLLFAALSVSCEPQPGGDRMEVFMVLGLSGFPASTVVALIPDRYLDACNTSGCTAAWLLYCAVGLVQWYFVLRALNWATTKLYQRFRAIGTRTAG
jgi:hypothetical protein